VEEDVSETGKYSREGKTEICEAHFSQYSCRQGKDSVLHNISSLAGTEQWYE
jgi:hypothetical protein